MHSTVTVDQFTDRFGEVAMLSGPETLVTLMWRVPDQEVTTYQELADHHVLLGFLNTTPVFGE